MINLNDRIVHFSNLFVGNCGLLLSLETPIIFLPITIEKVGALFKVP